MAKTLSYQTLQKSFNVTERSTCNGFFSSAFFQRACIFLPPTPFPTTGIEMPPSHAVLSRPWLTATSTSSLRIELALPQASWSWMPSAAFADRAQSHGAILLRIKSPCEQIICLILCNTFLHWTIFKERSQGAILRIKTLANKRFVNYLVRFASSEHRGLLAGLKTPLILHHGVVFQATRRALTSIRTWSGEPDIDTGH